MNILAVIVNYRTAEMTMRSVKALASALEVYPLARTVVVDNDSKDGSVEKLRSDIDEAGLQKRAQVFSSPWNGGFAWGNNCAIRDALDGPDPPDYVYLLNSDAFPEKTALERLVTYLEEHPDVGIAGSYIHGADGAPHTSAFRFPSLASELETMIGIGIVSKLLSRWKIAPPLPTESTRVDWLAGASMMIRREVFESIGMFDEGYFLYFEETDFCLRAAHAGWSTAYVPKSSVEHIGSASTGYQDLSRPTPTYWYASRRRYFVKNHGVLILWSANFLYVVGGTIRRILSLLRNRRGPEHRRHLRDFLRFHLRFGPEPPSRPPRPPGLEPLQAGHKSTLSTP